MEDFGGLALVLPERERVAVPGDRAQLKRQIFPGDVAGQVFGGVANLHQRLFEMAAHGGVDEHLPGVELLEQVGLDFFLPDDFGDESGIFADEQEGNAFTDQFDPPETADGVFDVPRHIGGEGIFAEFVQCAKDVPGVQAGGGRVPQRERGDAVSVDVFGGFFKFGKAREGVAGGHVLVVVDFEEDGFVALDDEGVGGGGHGERRA